MVRQIPNRESELQVWYNDAGQNADGAGRTAGELLFSSLHSWRFYTMSATLSTTNLAPSPPSSLSLRTTFSRTSSYINKSQLYLANERDLCEIWQVGGKREPLFLGGQSGHIR